MLNVVGSIVMLAAGLSSIATLFSPLAILVSAAIFACGGTGLYDGTAGVLRAGHVQRPSSLLQRIWSATGCAAVRTAPVQIRTSAIAMAEMVLAAAAASIKVINICKSSFNVIGRVMYATERYG